MLYNIKHADGAVGFVVIAVGLAAIGWSWWQSKRDTEEMRGLDAEYERELAEAHLEQKRAKEMVDHSESTER